MATNLNIDTELLNEVFAACGFATKRETVNAGLSELLRKHRLKLLKELAGTVDYYEDYDYKALRHSKYET